MDDFIGLIVFVLILVPVSIVLMLAVVLARQTRLRAEMHEAFQQINLALRDNQTLINQLLQQAVPDTESSSPISSAQFEPSTSGGLDTTVVPENIVSESTSVSIATKEVEQIEQDPWNQIDQSAIEPGRFELAARKILREIWNWIIVGEGHRREDVAMEYAVASNWLLRIGVLILVTGIGFFLKYSIDNDLLGERARVALSLLTGLSMIVGGVRLVGGKYHLFSQGLLGGGISVLYFSVFAAHSFYHLLAMYPAFMLMIVVTACAAVLAIRLDSMLVAIFAIVGGYCTPILLSTGQVNFVGLFGYMLLLGIGILGINWFKQWHLLNFLSFCFNYLLFFGALQNYQVSYFWQVIPFLAAFFVLYSTTVFLFCLINKAKSSLLDLFALIINATIFFATAYHLIETAYGQIWVAFVSALLAAFYLGHAYYCLVRRVADKELLLSFIGLAAFFITITMPLLLSKQWITVSWALQALVMLWLAGKLRSAFLQQVAYVLYLIMLLRFCFMDLPGQYGQSIDAQQSLLAFLLGFSERIISFGIPILSLTLAYRLVEKPVSALELACGPENDVPLWLRDNWLLQGTVIVGAGLLFVVLQLELYRSFGYLYPPLRMPLLSLVWLAMCYLLLLRYISCSASWLLSCLKLFLLGLLIKLVGFDLPSWGLVFGPIGAGDNILTLRYGGYYSFKLALMRLLDFAAIIGFLVFGFQRLTQGDGGKLRQWLGAASLILLFTFLSLEVNSILYQYVPGFRSGGVSILWSIFALSLVFNGIKRRMPPLRLAGLALFALVAWKVFFIDLARLEQIYRIVAFILLGMLALGGAFFYMRYQQTFFSKAEDEIVS